jgi:23S rRNA (pseudouridine1915-N3)-methyltransferase
MEISILAVGRLKAGPERELCDRYLERVRKGGKSLGLRGVHVREIAESRAGRPADRLAAEERDLAALLPASGNIACLDERGELVDSQTFAKDLSRALEAAIPGLSFVIGGPDGLSAGLKERANRRISFGRVTWPHQIVRILLAEQLYRAMTILSGHPYHRA